MTIYILVPPVPRSGTPCWRDCESYFKTYCLASYQVVPLKTPEEIKIMAEGGRILARIMKELEKKVKPGIATKELNRLAESLIFKYNGKPSFKGHQEYPSALCASVNEVIVHAVPSGYKLKEGDILSLDLGILYQGFHTDMAITLAIGKVSPPALRLIEVTKKALEIGMEKIKPGNKTGDIGQAIQEYVESQGFSVVRELCGHGIGKNLHEEPPIPNYGKKGAGKEIKQGMVFCLEPMVTIGDWRIKKSQDGFGYETSDNSLSCHFEHTIAIAENSHQILTRIE